MAAVHWNELIWISFLVDGITDGDRIALVSHGIALVSHGIALASTMVQHDST